MYKHENNRKLYHVVAIRKNLTSISMLLNFIDFTRLLHSFKNYEVYIIYEKQLIFYNKTIFKLI